MPDGTPVPPLPLTVPRQVRFGVVLLSYAGAQPSAAGGSRPPTRSKPDAQALAEKILLTATQDFHAAVQQGDGGSSDDVGRVKLGVLEPAPEYVLFTLPVDGIGGPVDTPRGYWIVKRLE
jgi:parvulin-like peptidyl-prolyl isomerase